MKARKKHPNKDIEAAIKYAEEKGWIYKDSGNSSHAWGKLFCPLHTRDGHHISIYTTPSSPSNYARLIKQRIDKCEHGNED